MMSRSPREGAIVWRTPEGAPVSCAEKVKVMAQNFEELRQVMQDALEDAVLMGCDEDQVRSEIARLADRLETSFRKR